MSVMQKPRSAKPQSSHALAAAMLEGLEARRFFRLPERSKPNPPTATLMPYSGLLGFPAPRTGGLPGRFLRAIRQALKKILAPWFELQTRFNHETVNYLHEIHTRTSELEVQMTTLHTRMTSCFAELNWNQPAANDAIEHCGDPVSSIENLFLHTRLPSPPGRALVFDETGKRAAELAALGFDTVLCGNATVRHPAVKIVPRAGNGLPFEDASFDVIIALSAAEPWADIAWRCELARVLSPGGRVIGSADASMPWKPSSLEPFGLRETAFASRAGGGWSLRPTITEDSEVALWVAERQSDVAGKPR